MWRTAADRGEQSFIVEVRYIGIRLKRQFIFRNGRAVQNDLRSLRSADQPFGAAGIAVVQRIEDELDPGRDA